MTFEDYYSALDARPTTNPSFSPMPGERLALQMPGLFLGFSDYLNRDQGPGVVPLPGLRNNTGPYAANPVSTQYGNYSLTNDLRALLLGYNDPTGFREMPRSQGVPFIPERNTEVIAGPPQPEATPYPNPPWLNFQNWLNTGERGPLPLESRLPGRYPQPANTPMPEVYDTRTSGGMLAGGGAQSAYSRQLYDKYNYRPIPAAAMAPDFTSGNQPLMASARPDTLPSPPMVPPDRGDRLRRMLIDQVISPEQRAEIAANPGGLKALATYAGLAGIMLGGGEETPLGPKGAVPHEIWNSWKPIKPQPGGGEVRVDNAGNHFQLTGSHDTTQGYYAIVKPVEPPLTYAQQHDQEVSDLSKALGGLHSDLSAIRQWEEGLKSGDITQAQYDAAVDAIKKGGMPPLPPSKPLKPEPGSKWAEYQKLLEYGEKLKSWGNINDRKYSGPLTGQNWADLYATPDTEFTAGPPKTNPFKDYESPPITNWPDNWDQMTPEQQQFFKDRWGFKPPP